MFIFAIILAFLAPFFWRVFWKSYDEFDELEDRLLAGLPEVVGHVIGALVFAAILALGLYKLAEFSIEASAGTAITAAAVLLRINLGTFESRIIGRIVASVHGGVMALKARSIR
ncbi:hypothetical protein [Microvirga sp. VF16]|uniref:hypothetical protein n=1 Tax=Microvirga sp. VF16 TaxID=2807101 RepID=UPI00193E4F41|nr:hypothetical protein [Microvirga sp. VF16]QRM34991.1 hypothetical protein JO965_42790 [Microvirga sp. VF16]